MEEKTYFRGNPFQRYPSSLYSFTKYPCILKMLTLQSSQSSFLCHCVFTTKYNYPSNFAHCETQDQEY